MNLFLKILRNLEALFHAAGSHREDHEGSAKDETWDNEEDNNQLDSDIDDDDYHFYGEKVTGPNSQKQHDGVSSEEFLKKFVSRIKIEKYEGVGSLPSGAGNKIITSSKKITANRYIKLLTINVSLSLLSCINYSP